MQADSPPTPYCTKSRFSNCKTHSGRLIFSVERPSDFRFRFIMDACPVSEFSEPNEGSVNAEGKDWDRDSPQVQADRLVRRFHGNAQTVLREISDSARSVSSFIEEEQCATSTPGAKFFQLYIDSEVFSIKESKKRLKLFAERVSSRGLSEKHELKLKQSHEFEQVNVDPIRKILKKHAKPTALPHPFPNGQDYFTQALALAPRGRDIIPIVMVTPIKYHVRAPTVGRADGSNID
ncbi:hypothetical protein BDP27DRAFT_1520143 [Rhodocollybia butyracea]|uniref:Uncharacterized protein n=1 Tax=Rhodocollybia butyracea TaxID=206335 RepID=A0A9P5U702_9AGAR|nr:hypothetical protein BDP27DRAFT_1520143 [Rhodocollybia butyracea]